MSITIRTDHTMNLTTATLTSDYVIVSVQGRSGVYQTAPGKSPTARTGTLIYACTGSADEFVAGLEVTGASVERIVDDEAPLDADDFPPTIDFGAPETTESVLVDKIARLQKKADSEDREEALNGGYGRAGAITREKAEAFAEALDIYRKHG